MKILALQHLMYSLITGEITLPEVPPIVEGKKVLKFQGKPFCVDYDIETNTYSVVTE